MITYELDYDLNVPAGASTTVVSVDNPATYNVTDTVVLAEPTLEGYTFEGWFEKASDGTVASTKTTSFSQQVGDKTFVGKWKANDYAITWNYNGPVIGGATFTTTTQTFDAAIAAPADPTWTGYEFKGWYTTDGTNASDMGVQVDTTKTYTTPSASTYFARWEKKVGTIAYNVTDGGAFPTALNPASEVGAGKLLSATKDSGTSITATYDITTATIPLSAFAPERTGWTFKGWSQDGTTVLTALAPANLWDTTTNAGYQSCTLTSLWCQDFSVTYANVEGAYITTPGETLSLSPSTYNELTPASGRVLPTGLNRQGYTFGGWTLDPDATPVKIETSIAQNATGDVTFYAVWDAVGYDIALDLGTDGAWSDGSTTRTKLSTNYDVKTVTVPSETVVRSGNRAFLGWQAYDAEGNAVNVLVQDGSGAWVPYTRYLAPGVTYQVLDMGAGMPDVAKLEAVFSDAINVAVPIDVNLDVTADFVTNTLLVKESGSSEGSAPYATREFESRSSGDVVIAEVGDDPTDQATRLAAAASVFGKRSPTAYQSVYLTFGADDANATVHRLQLGGSPIQVTSAADRADLTVASGQKLPVRIGLAFGPALTDADLDIGQVSVPLLKLYYKVALADDGNGNPSYPSGGIKLEPVAATS